MAYMKIRHSHLWNAFAPLLRKPSASKGDDVTLTLPHSRCGPQDEAPPLELPQPKSRRFLHHLSRIKVY